MNKKLSGTELGGRRRKCVFFPFHSLLLLPGETCVLVCELRCLPAAQTGRTRIVRQLLNGSGLGGLRPVMHVFSRARFFTLSDANEKKYLLRASTPYVLAAVAPNGTPCVTDSPELKRLTTGDRKRVMRDFEAIVRLRKDFFTPENKSG